MFKQRIVRASCLALLAAGLLNARLPADDNRQDDVVGKSGLKLSQAELLRRFEAESQQEYTIGAGDEIEIQVLGQTDLTGHHVVGPDGRITLPLIGPMQVSGQTREEAAQAIAKAWRQYYSTVNVTISVSKYASNRIVVVGRVASPGPLYFDTAPTLLEALAKSGAYGPRPAVAGATQYGVAPVGTQNTLIARCAVYRGSEQVLWIDMNQFFANGSTIDLHLIRNDVVYVPDQQEALVSVLGQVLHPGPVRINPDTRLIDVLTLAGGVTEDAASDKIRLVRPSTGMTREFSLKDLLDPIKARMAEGSIQSGDVVYVPQTGFAKVGYVLGKLSPAGTIMMFGALAAGR